MKKDLHIFSTYGTSVAVPVIAGVIIGARTLYSWFVSFGKAEHSAAEHAVDGSVKFVKISSLDHLDDCGK